jgi:hypothetical protein
MEETPQERFVDLTLEVDSLQRAVLRARAQSRWLTILGFVSGLVCGLLLAGMLPR